MASLAMKIERKQDDVSESGVQLNDGETVDHAAIAARAYELWQARGCPIGSSEADWFQAEEELRQKGPSATAA